ncbi:MAG: response regulator [Anaerolineae bacterium]|nr:response regulator [Anaerolineae bacterium]
MTSLQVIPKIMILDDEPAIRDVLRLRLEREGYQVIQAGNFKEFKKVMVDCDAVLCDIILPGDSGLLALEWTRKYYPFTPVIILTGKPSYETAAEAIRLNAYDYLAKPVEKDELLLSIERAIQHRRLNLEKKRLEEENEAYRLKLEQRVVEQTEALEESQEFLATISNTIADVVVSIRLPDYKIAYANRAVTDVFGYKPEELLDQNIAILFADDSRFEAFQRQKKVALATGQIQIRLEEAMIKKSGQPIWSEMVGVFLKNGDNVTQIICVIRDISQRSLLLGVVAHELRSPLSLVAGFSQAVLRDINDIDRDSIAKYLKVIDDSAARMLRIVDGLLDITSVQLGQVDLKLETVDLNWLVRKFSGDYAYVAGKKNIKLIEKLSEAELKCQCDSAKIGQVISNFIDNAIKFSDVDSKIELIGKRKNNEIWVGVKDEGPGVKSEETQHLFKSFGHTKISNRPTGGEKSSGLGLAICKRIIDAHQGKIGIESELDQGSTFWFSLPIGPKIDKAQD